MSQLYIAGSGGGGGGGDVNTLTGDVGGAISPDGGGNITLAGGTNFNTSGAGNTITFNLDDAITLATSVSSPLYTVASGDIVLNMTDDAGATYVSFTNNSDVEVASIDSLGNAIFNSVTGDINVSGATQYAVAVYGASGALSEVSGVGTSGQVLTSNGAGMNPTWQDAASSDTVVTTDIDNTDSPYAALSTDVFISADVSAAAITVQLPNAPSTGRFFYVKDVAGNAATFNITVTTVGGAVNIDGATTFVMNTDYESGSFVFNGTSYSVF